MGKVINIKMLALFASIVCSVAYAEEAAQPAEEAAQPAEEAAQLGTDTLQKNIGYFFGFAFGNNLMQGGNQNVNFDDMKKGFEDALNGRQPNLSKADQEAAIAEIKSRQEKIQDLAQQEGLEMARQYLAENAKKDGVIVTASGLQYEVLEAGAGKQPAATDTVKVNYEGKLTSGQIFDSSIKRGEPVEFQLNQVIPGWTEGVQLMHEGGKFKFTIPSELAYGAGGTRGIPPNSVLVFEVDLLEVK